MRINNSINFEGTYKLQPKGKRYYEMREVLADKIQKKAEQVLGEKAKEISTTSSLWDYEFHFPDKLREPMRKIIAAAKRSVRREAQAMIRKAQRLGQIKVKYSPERW